MAHYLKSPNEKPSEKDRYNRALARLTPERAWEIIRERVEGCESRALLQAYLDCEADSAPDLFPGDEWYAWSKITDDSGDDCIVDLVTEQIARLDREDRAAELCFQRAEECRRKKA